MCMATVTVRGLDRSGPYPKVITNKGRYALYRGNRRLEAALERLAGRTVTVDTYRGRIVKIVEA